MNAQVQIITTPFIFNISVNCYLVRVNDGFILIDTATAGKRHMVEKALAQAGCTPGTLKLIVLTHGDFDHCGNAAYLRQKYGTKVAMHMDDMGMVERGDMFWNRKQPNVLVKAFISLFLGLRPSDRFKPDFYLREGDSLNAYGLDARVLSLPGHSKGNIGILTAAGHLFCGDLFGNLNQPELWSLIDDQTAAEASVRKVQSLPVTTVYPGHGKPFQIAQLRSLLPQPELAGAS